MTMLATCMVLVGASVTVISAVSVPVAPPSSVTVKVTVYIPAVE